MSRFFTISLLLLGLGFAAYDGFQTQAQTAAGKPPADLHSTDAVLIPTN